MNRALVGWELDDRTCEWGRVLHVAGLSLVLLALRTRPDCYVAVVGTWRGSGVYVTWQGAAHEAEAHCRMLLDSVAKTLSVGESA